MSAYKNQLASGYLLMQAQYPFDLALHGNPHIHPSSRAPRPISAATACVGLMCPSSNATTAPEIGISTPRLRAR